MGQKQCVTELEFVDDIAKCTDFTKNEVIEWYISFKNESGKDELTLEEFQRIFQQYFPKGDSKAFAEHAFR